MPNPQPNQPVKWTLTKGNVGGALLSLLGLVFYLDQIWPGEWFPTDIYSKAAGMISLATGVAISIFSPPLRASEAR